MIDYWCNAFTPDREPLWNQVITDDGLSLKLGARLDDAFAPVEVMVDRMDRLGIATLVLPVCDLPPGAPLDDFAHYAARPDEILSWSQAHPGRFVGMFSVDPGSGASGHAAAVEALNSDWCVALHTHTHSWDRRLDHPDYTPYHALCADHRVPFVLQAGRSGGHHVHESGHPDAIAGPAEAFPGVPFVLSHTGDPWVTQTISAARRFDNVVIGTATHPPRRWPAELVDHLRHVGRHDVLLGTGYPLTGHGHVLTQLDALDLPDDVRHDLVEGNARRVFTRIPDAARIPSKARIPDSPGG